MDSANLILTGGTVSPPAFLEQMKLTKGVSESQKKQYAKDFESVFINKLLDEMKKTIGDWGDEKDGASQQIQGIFWLYLARDIADNGGFGMWKDIYRFMNDSEQKNIVPELLDENL
jgi:Rod binding domain-containing protein